MMRVVREVLKLCHLSYNHKKYCTFARAKGGAQVLHAPRWICHCKATRVDSSTEEIHTQRGTLYRCSHTCKIIEGQESIESFCSFSISSMYQIILKELNATLVSGVSRIVLD